VFGLNDFDRSAMVLEEQSHESKTDLRRWNVDLGCRMLL
jgi:hypothetical protein